MKTTITEEEQPGVAAERRISRSATLSLNGKIDVVFPLFGPVREKEWAFGWNPEIIWSSDPLIAEGMIFRTRGEENYNWVVSKYLPESYTVEYTVSTSQRIWFIKVVCSHDGPRTSATVTYTYTALTNHGARLNREALIKMYASDLKDWELAINYYLKTGQQLLP